MDVTSWLSRSPLWILDPTGSKISHFHMAKTWCKKQWTLNHFSFNFYRSCVDSIQQKSSFSSTKILTGLCLGFWDKIKRNQLLFIPQSNVLLSLRPLDRIAILTFWKWLLVNRQNPIWYPRHYFVLHIQANLHVK